MIGYPEWPDGDRRRESVKGRPPVDNCVPRPPDDVRATYVHVFWHDYNWYKNPRPHVYVHGFRRHRVGEDKHVWDTHADTLRLVKKRDALHSVIVPGADDFWLLDNENPDYLFLDNMRRGLQQVTYILKRDCAGRIKTQLGVVPAMIPPAPEE